MNRLEKLIGARRALVFMCALLIIVSAQPAAAQLSLSPYAGLLLYDGSLGLYENGERQSPGIEGDGVVPTLGLRLGHDLSQRWSAELSYGRSFMENSAGSLANHQAHLLLSYAFLRSGRLALSAGGGAGVMSYRSDDSSLTDPIIAGGIGGAWRVREGIAFRSDLRFYGQFCSVQDVQNGLGCNDGSQLGYSELSVGVRIRP